MCHTQQLICQHDNTIMIIKINHKAKIKDYESVELCYIAYIPFSHTHTHTCTVS